MSLKETILWIRDFLSCVLVGIGILFIVVFFASGCQKPIVIHPIEKSDIFTVPKGSVLVIGEEEMTVEKDGWFLSDVYVEEVMDAKVGGTKVERFERIEYE